MRQGGSRATGITSVILAALNGLRMLFRYLNTKLGLKIMESVQRHVEQASNN